MQAIVLYGISNCDSVRKARKWLSANDIDFHFHDFRKDGLESKTVKAWLKHCDWNTLLNRRSTSWKDLPASTRDKVSEDNVLELLLATPTLIKRPVLQLPDDVMVGFKATDYESRLSDKSSTNKTKWKH